MDLLPEKYYLDAFLLGILFQGAIAWVFRRRLAGVFDIFLLQCLYVAFGTSSLWLVFKDSGLPKVGSELVLLALWLLGMAAADRGQRFLVRSRSNRASLYQPKRHLVSRHDKSAVLVVSTLYVLYAIQIMQSGIFSLDGSLIDGRFIVQQDNKLQGYLFSAAGILPPVLLYRLNPSLRLSRFLLLLLPFWLVQLSTLSKTGMLFPAVGACIFYSLRVHGGITRRLSNKSQLVFAGCLSALVITVFLVITTYIKPTDVTAISLLLNRLFSSFDGLVYLAKIPLDESITMSLPQWYLSPFLKFFGFFDQPYNSFNYLIATQYFGLPGDYAGMLPNNNHIGELMVSVPGGFQAVAALVSGLVYGLLYFSSVKYVLRGGALIIPAGFITATPFGVMVDGQGWFIALACACTLALLALPLSALIGTRLTLHPKRRIASRRPFQTTQAGRTAAGFPSGS